MPEPEIRVFPGQSDDVYADVFLKPEARAGYASRDGRVELPVYLARIVGVDEEAAYINRVFDLAERLGREKRSCLRLESDLPKTLPAAWMDAFNETWKVIGPMRNPRAADIAEICLRSALLGTLEPGGRQLLKSSLALVLGLFASRVDNKDIIKNFLIKQLYWLKLYFLPETGFYQPGGEVPAALFWGAASRDEAYFLLLLATLGCDVLCFDPAARGKWAEVPHIEDYSLVLQYPGRQEMPHFPRTPRGKKEETVAYRAEQEIHQMLHTPETGAFTPWQLESFYPAPFTLSTTYEEMLLLWGQEARFRPGFEVRDGLVMSPVIFAKVAGVAADLDGYIEKIQSLHSEQLLLKDIRSLPLPAAAAAGIDRSLLDDKGQFVLEKVAARYRQAPFARLRPAMQELLVRKINELASLADYLMLERSPENRFRIFRIIMGLDRSYLDLLQQYDFPFQVPKLLVFDSGEPGLSENDAIVMAFLHLVGFDIVIICPGGYADLEPYFADGYYQVHRLEQFRFDLQSGILDKKPRKGFLDWLMH